MGMLILNMILPNRMEVCPSGINLVLFFLASPLLLSPQLSSTVAFHLSAWFIWPTRAPSPNLPTLSHEH